MALAKKTPKWLQSQDFEMGIQKKRNRVGVFM